MYRFQSLEISDVGPFRQSHVLDLSGKFVGIFGGNGTGKSTIARCLLADVPKSKLHISGQRSPTVPLWMQSLGDVQDQVVDSGVASESLAQLMSTFHISGARQAKFELHLTRVLSDITRPKALWWSEAKGESSEFLDLTVQCQPDGHLSVYSKASGTDLNWGFQARGEQVALQVATSCALRHLDVDEFDVPCVCDLAFGALDGLTRRAVFHALMQEMPQLVVLDHEQVFTEMGIRARYGLNLTADLRNSELSRTQE